MSEGLAKNRGMVTTAIMLATLMSTLDSSIANVALPHIQGSLSAAPDQIAWVLTSYIVVGAMTTPLGGWLATRFGMKKVFLGVISGFVVSSIACGLAANLAELVLFRMAQGACGACMIPLSQAVLLNINPPENHAKAMSLWGAGTILGPLLGPVLGGYITDQSSWRWCFLINLPVGVIALLGVWIFMAADKPGVKSRFDFLGFSSLITAVAGLQLMLDRGPGQDWFSSAEIWTDALIAIGAFWVCVVHTIMAPNPFINRALLRDRNLMTTTALGFFAGSVIFSPLAILPTYMQSLLGYPVFTSGIVSIPRGVGMMLAIALAAPAMSRLGMRFVLMMGFAMNALAFWQMMHFDIVIGFGPLITSGFWMGLGQGLFFIPMTTLAFATVDPALRPQASALYNLVRSVGASVGISVVQALATTNTQVMHAAIAAKIILSDSVVRLGLPAALWPTTAAGAEALNSEITRQATMVAYLDDFRLLFVLSMICIPTVIFLRPAKKAPLDPAHIAVE